MYREIDEHFEANGKRDDYNVELLPVFGWGHETLQSAFVMSHGNVDVRADLPPEVDPVFTDGDGTVPRVSAIPIELNDKPLRWWPVNQKHATLQNNEHLDNNLTQVLAALQGQLQVPARALGTGVTEKGIGLQVDDVYLPDEPVVVRVSTNIDGDPQGVTARIEPISGSDLTRDLDLKPEGNLWIGEATGLALGTYKVTVILQNEAVGPPDPLTDIFAVV